MRALIVIGGSVLVVLSLLIGCESSDTSSCDSSVARFQAVGKEPEPVVWTTLNLRNGDTLRCVLLTDDFRIKTDYDVINLPMDLLGSISWGETGKHDVATLWGQTSRNSFSSAANKLSGTVVPNEIRVRLVTGQELEFESKQIKSLDIQNERAGSVLERDAPWNRASERQPATAPR